MGRPNKMRPRGSTETDVASEATLLAVAKAIASRVGSPSTTANSQTALPQLPGLRLTGSRLCELNADTHLGCAFIFDLVPASCCTCGTCSWARVRAAHTELELCAEIAALLAATSMALSLEDPVLVLALALVERMQHLLECATVRPIVLTTLAIAAKEWYDDEVTLDEFREALPHLRLCRLHEMESEVLKILDYDVLLVDTTWGQLNAELVSVADVQPPFLQSLRAGYGNVLDAIAGACDVQTAFASPPAQQPIEAAARRRSNGRRGPPARRPPLALTPHPNRRPPSPPPLTSPPRKRPGRGKPQESNALPLLAAAARGQVRRFGTQAAVRRRE